MSGSLVGYGFSHGGGQHNGTKAHKGGDVKPC